MTSENVVHVMRTYGVHGGERQLRQLFSQFPQGGYCNTFVFVYRDPVCAEYFRAVRSLRMATLIPLRASTFPSMWIEIGVLLVLLPVLQLRLMYILWRSKARICVAHGLQGALVSWGAAWLMRGTKFVYVHRGTKSKRGRHPAFRMLYRPFAVVAGVSSASAQSLMGLAAGGQPVVLENGIDAQSIEETRRRCTPGAPPHDSPLILSSVGRLIPGKDHSLLLQSMIRIVRHVPNCQLWIVGDGPERARLEQECIDLQIGDHVRFLGYADNVICLLAQSHIFLYASESEGMSNAVLEAMIMRLPSVVVAAAGVTECHVDGKTGYVVTRSAEEIAEKVVLLGNDHASRLRMGDEAHAHVCKHYSIAANARRYLDMYRSLLSD